MVNAQVVTHSSPHLTQFSEAQRLYLYIENTKANGCGSEEVPARGVFTLMRGTRAGPCTNNNKELTEKLKITSIVNSPLISNEEQVLCYSLFIRKLYIASAV